MIAGPARDRYREVTVLARSTIRLLAFSLATGALVSAPRPARAAEERGGAAAPEPTREEVEAWLDARGLPAASAERSDGDPDAPPPLPPRPHGFVVTGGVGALQHLGPMKHVTPLAPLFHLEFGWEPARWVMLLAESDLSFGNTSYARPPPEPRGYVLYGFGGGLRFTVKPTDRVGLYAQGTIGAAGIPSDVLVTYGYRDSTSLSPYFGGVLGVEWYQVSPHTALALFGGLRDYSVLLDRTAASQRALAAYGALALRYVF
ncbi:MAG: hypothetical protein OZ921_16875 [Sorangiineae bacterium]|nr:hypothetical protein [Polyangiaceae bacterium]MEB2324189.1 hypothetical protein [Sorangiineae bacterium]